MCTGTSCCKRVPSNPRKTKKNKNKKNKKTKKKGTTTTIFLSTIYLSPISLPAIFLPAGPSTISPTLSLRLHDYRLHFSPTAWLSAHHYGLYLLSNAFFSYSIFISGMIIKAWLWLGTLFGLRRLVLSVFCMVLWRETLSHFVRYVCVYLVCLGSIRPVFVYGIYPVG